MSPTPDTAPKSERARRDARGVLLVCALAVAGLPGIVSLAAGQILDLSPGPSRALAAGGAIALAAAIALLALRGAGGTAPRRGGRARAGLALALVLLGAPFLVRILDDLMGLLARAPLLGRFVPEALPLPLGPLPDWRLAAAGAGLWAAALLAAALVARWLERDEALGALASRSAARWLRAALWGLGLGAAASAAAALGGGAIARGIGAAVLVIAALLGLEALGRTLLALVSGPASDATRARAASPPGTEGALLALLFSRWNPLASLFAGLEAALDIDVRGAAAIAVTRRALPPIAAGLVFAAWLLSTLVVLDVHERGLLERFGRLAREEPLGPGLHFKAPWPIERVVRVDAERVRSMPIGFAEPDPSASMLWTARHAAEEYQLLLGEGRDLVTINAQLAWRVDDARSFVYGHRDPERTLAAIADRVVLERIVGESLDGLLGERLELEAEAMERAIAAEARARGLGVEVVDLTILGLHPPVAVAAEYQEVVGAKIERRALELEGRAYRAETIPAAEAEALRLLADARAFAATRTRGARGEAEAFMSIAEGVGLHPELYRFRRRLETLERSLEGRHFHVTDERIWRQGGSVWILE